MFTTLQQKLKLVLIRCGPYTWYMLQSQNERGEHKKRLVTLQNTINTNILNFEFMNSTGVNCEINKSL